MELSSAWPCSQAPLEFQQGKSRQQTFLYVTISAGLGSICSASGAVAVRRLLHAETGLFQGDEQPPWQ